jgi:Cdc6-like AAA superfamily ATPase
MMKHATEKSPTDAPAAGGFVEIPNNYSPYDIDSGRWFYHEDLIKKIKTEFSQPENDVLFIRGYRGSGKTSTLKKIVENQEILGAEFFPIYLDSGKIKPVAEGLFFLFVYKTVRDKLKNFGIQIDLPDYSLQSGVSLAEIEFYLQQINRGLNANQTVILIFDDIEELLAAEAEATIDAITRFFNSIYVNNQRFRLILAGRGENIDLMDKRGMGDFLNRARQLELGGFLEKSEIECLIIRPVEGFLEYDPAATQKIIEITGGNIYCQKLLCYYLINFLNTKKQNYCTPEDVAEAVQLTLKDKREDFNYFWQNMRPDNKLVAAALADHSITKERGQFYFLEEDSLLDLILERDELYPALSRMTADRYIKRINARRFDEYPYKIPLYGYWVQQEHAFVQTVLDSWDWIAARVSLATLEKLLQRLPQEQIPLEKEIIDTTLLLSKFWLEIQEQLTRGKGQRPQIEKLVVALCHLLDFEVKMRPEDRKSFFRINMSNLNLSGLSDVLLFIPTKEEYSDLDVAYFQDEILRQDHPGNPSFVLCLKRTEKIQELAQKRFLGVVIIDESDLKQVMLSARPLQTFRTRVLLRQVSPALISTYQTEGPVTQTFFGRHDEIGKIVRTKNRNFAIVGSRKMGKTSLLFKVRDYLPSNTHAFYLDLEAPRALNYETFLTMLFDELNQGSPVMDFDPNLDNLRKSIREFTRQTQKTPVFLLDEIDVLLEYDIHHDYQLTKTLRALFNENRCQVIFSGYEMLFHETQRLNSPLYNFCQTIQLDKLKEKDALDLITSPMESIGIQYQNPEDRALILRHTGGHPNLLQFACKYLVEKIEEHEDESDRRMIARQDIEDFFRSFEYESYVINDFYSFFTPDINPIEKLIVLLPLVDSSAEVISANELKKLLLANQIEIPVGELLFHLANLTLRFLFIAEAGGKYRFALPTFPEILRRRNNLSDLIQEAKADVQKSL